MIRMVLFLLGLLALATGLSWLADRPGSLLITWEGWEIQTSVFRAVVLFAIIVASAVFMWSMLRQLLTSPAALGRYFNRRRQEKGLDAISSGMIAIGAGDRSLATRYAVQARRTLPNEPLTHLLRAQAAQLSGDRATSRRIFEAMLGSPDTEQLGLRGLYLEAQQERETEAARQFAERAMRLNPKLGWPVEALFEMHCRDGDWPRALETLAVGRKNGQLDKAVADRRRAVLLTAQAQPIEDTNGQKAQQLALEAHGLAPDLIPAAAIAARQLASRGSTAKAAKVVERTWKTAQHPELALVYAYARPGDSPRDRLDRIKRLARMAPHSPEGPIALATAAIEAHEWAEARSALQPLVDGDLTQRVCTLMARIEGGQNNDAGRVREWLARAVTAPRDPAWTADGVVAERWAPVSPVTGALDAFAWKVPPEPVSESEAGRALKQIEELVMLGSPRPAAEPRAPVAGAPKAYGPPSTAREATTEVDEVVRAEPLRTRSGDADRPITVEVRPVTVDAGAGKGASELVPAGRQSGIAGTASTGIAGAASAGTGGEGGSREPRGSVPPVQARDTSASKAAE